MPPVFGSVGNPEMSEVDASSDNRVVPIADAASVHSVLERRTTRLSAPFQATHSARQTPASSHSLSESGCLGVDRDAGRRRREQQHPKERRQRPRSPKRQRRIVLAPKWQQMHIGLSLGPWRSRSTSGSIPTKALMCSVSGEAQIIFRHKQAFLDGTSSSCRLICRELHESMSFISQVSPCRVTARRRPSPRDTLAN